MAEDNPPVSEIPPNMEEMSAFDEGTQSRYVSKRKVGRQKEKEGLMM